MTRFRRAAVLALAALFLAACGSPASPSGTDPTEIRVTVSNATEPYVIPWLVGDEQGLFAAHGVEIGEIIAGHGGSTTLRNLVSGDLAVGDVSLPAVIEAKLAGTPVTVVGGATRSVYGLDFYAAADSPVQTIADAKRWAFTNPASVTESLTYLVPEAAGIDANAVQRVSSGGIGEGIALLESGEVDVAVVPPSLVAKGGDRFRLIAASADHIPAFQQSVLTVRDDYLAAHPDVVAGVVAGYHDAVASIRENPAEAARLYAEHIGIDETNAREVVDAAVRADNWSAGLDRLALDNALEAMRAAGFSEEVPWCEMVELDHLPDGAPRDLPVSCGGTS